MRSHLLNVVVTLLPLAVAGSAALACGDHAHRGRRESVRQHVRVRLDLGGCGRVRHARSRRPEAQQADRPGTCGPFSLRRRCRRGQPVGRGLRRRTDRARQSEDDEGRRADRSRQARVGCALRRRRGLGVEPRRRNRRAHRPEDEPRRRTDRNRRQPREHGVRRGRGVGRIEQRRCRLSDRSRNERVQHRSSRPGRAGLDHVGRRLALGVESQRLDGDALRPRQRDGRRDDPGRPRACGVGNRRRRDACSSRARPTARSRASTPRRTPWCR